MAKISDLTEMTEGQLAGDDEIAVVDTTAGSTKKVDLSKIAAVLDGDHLDITFTPSGYSPDAAGAAEADDVDDLAAHLKGIDTELANAITTAASEISAITEKATPVAADMILIEDSADSNAKKMVQVGELLPTRVNRPGFCVLLSNAMLNIVAGAADTLEFDSKVWFQPSSATDFNVATYTFTAPQAGKYLFTCDLRTQSVDVDATYVYMILVTSNRSYALDIIDPDAFDSDPVYWTFTGSIIADMDLNDTAKMTIYQDAGANQMDIPAGTSYFQGILLD